MKERLRSLFPLFLALRFKVNPINKHYVILTKIIFFFQTSLVALFSSKPIKISGLDLNEEPGIHMLQCVLGIQWFSQPEYLIYDVWYLTFFQVICLFNIKVNKNIVDKGQTPSIVSLKFMQYCMHVIPNLLAVPLYFRLAIVIDLMVSNFEALLFIPFFSIVISIILLHLIDFLRSIFIDPYDMIIRNDVDMHENPSGLLRQECLTLQVVVSFLLFTSTNTIFRYIISVFIFTISFVDFYLRVIPIIYCSPVINMLDNAFTLIIPILSVIRALAINKPYVSIILYIAILVITAVILKLIKMYIYKKAVEMISIFLNTNHTEPFGGSILSPFNFISIIRCAAVIDPNPFIYDRLIEMQHSYSRRGAVVIEIARGLGFYPDRRREVIEEIEQTNSKSIHNQFVLCAIRERLISIQEMSSESDRREIMEERQEFIEAMVRYWTARIEKSRIKAMGAGLSAFYLSHSVTQAALHLTEKFPFDAKARRIYIEVLMITNGTATQIQNQQNIMNELQDEGHVVTDPIMHATTRTHPNFMRYLSPDDIQKCSASSPMQLKQEAPLRRPVWSYLNPSEPKYVPFIFMSFIIPPLLLLIFGILLCRFEIYSSSVGYQVAQTTAKTVHSFFMAETTAFFPFAYESINISSETVGTDLERCQVQFLDTLISLQSYYSSISNASGLVEFTLPVVTTYFKNVINNTDDICSLLKHFLDFSFSNQYLDLTTGTLQKTWQVIAEQKEALKDDSRYLVIFILMPAAFIITFIATFLSIYITMSSSFENMSMYFPYLGSESRTKLIKAGMSAEAWDLLYKYIDHEGHFPTAKMSLHPEELVAIEQENEFKDFDVSSRGSHLAVYWFLIGIVWISCIIHFANIIISHNYRTRIEIDNINHLEITFDLTRTSVLLQSEIADLILGKNANKSLILSFSSEIESHKSHGICEAYNINRATVGGKNYSVHGLVDKIVNQDEYESIGEEFWKQSFIPIVTQFAQECIVDHFAKECGKGHPLNNLSIVVFIVQLLAVLITNVLIGLRVSYLVSQYFNVLHQFPSRFIELNTPSKEDAWDNGDVDAENMIVVRSVAETGAIFSVSPTSHQLIGKKPEQLINEQLGDVFEDVVGEVPIVKTIDQKSEKFFRVQSDQVGPIRRDLYVDDATKTGSGNQTKDSVVIGQLTPFIPQFFAEQFVGSGQRSISLEDRHFIVIRLKETKAQEFDRFCGSFSMVINQYTSLRAVNMDSTLLTCVLAPRMNRAEVLMVMRDVVLRIGGMFHAAQLLFVERAEFEVVIDDEPYVEEVPGELSRAEAMVYKQPAGTVALSKSIGGDKWKTASEWEGLQLLSLDHFVMTVIGASTQ